MSGVEPVGRWAPPPRRTVVPLLGAAQIVAWGSSFYLLAVLAAPIRAETGWSLGWIVGGLSAALAVAGLASPLVGDTIQRRGGRPVLVASAIFLAAGLAGLAASRGLALYLGSWLVIGVGMSAGLYEAAFGTLGRIYGGGARGAIGALTLFGGFASTISWPLSSYLVAEVGWRGACLAYAGIHLLVLLPLYAALVPRPPPAPVGEPRAGAATAAIGAAGGADDPPRVRRATFALLTLATTLSALISTLLSVHLLTILQAGGLSAASAVAWATIVGPAQVGARALEMFLARRRHPIGTKLASAAFIASGVGLLAISLPLVGPALVLYGAGIGIESIARGTLPLALFGGRHFAAAMGRIALPSLVVQAAAPMIGAGLIAALGGRGALIALAGTGAVNVAVVGLLWRGLPGAARRR